MLRFVKIGGQIIEGDKSFAYFDTVRDRFIEFNDCQVFESWEDFLMWRKDEENKYPQFGLDRFWGITPHNIRPTLLAPDAPQARSESDEK